jgi:hypothetical protein
MGVGVAVSLGGGVHNNPDQGVHTKSTGLHYRQAIEKTVTPLNLLTIISDAQQVL